MHTEKYLNRIKYSKSLEPNLQTLKKLQKSHLLNIPFENLDIHNNIPIELSIDKIFDKIVNQNRGGFCYELNGLFYELLISLNFNAKRISARVFNKDNGYGQEFDHFAILVTIGNSEYLTDVGFGEFSFEPLKFEINKIQNDELGDFIFEKYDKDYFRVSKIKNESIIPEYIFTTNRRELLDFKDMCIYHQSSPKSHFTTKRLISLPNINGRVTITGNKLIVKKFNSKTETEIKTETEFKKIYEYKSCIKNGSQF